MAIKCKYLLNNYKLWAAILVAQIILFYILSTAEWAVTGFAQFFDWQRIVHQQIFSAFSISIGDVLYIILLVTIGGFIVKIFRKNLRRKYLIRLFILINFLYFFYQLFWGMLYFQRPIFDVLPKDEIGIAETKEVTIKYLKLCKDDRAYVDEDENGVFRISDLNVLEDEILHGHQQIPRFIYDKKLSDFSSLKKSLFKNIMSYTGIMGYYNPFTGEAQYNPNLPNTYLPTTIAHESAHQLGFAREQEANFIAYLIGKDAPNVNIRYATEYFVLKSLLNSLIENDPKFVEELLNNYSPGMKRDRDYEHRFNKEHSGIMNEFFAFTNNLFLKSNQQEGSITYSYFVDLLIRYERLN